MLPSNVGTKDVNKVACLSTQHSAGSRQAPELSHNGHKAAVHAFSLRAGEAQLLAG